MDNINKFKTINLRRSEYFVLFIFSFFLLSACSPLSVIVSSSGEQPAPQESWGLAAGYQAVSVDQVVVEVGVGSPIPVHVIVNGNLPDTCAQVDYVEQKWDGSSIILTLSSVPSSSEGCIQDSLPFTMSIPLNVIDLPAGTNTVVVNGIRSNFNLNTENSASEPWSPDSAIIKDNIQVDNVNMVIGTGSPVPVHAVVSLYLPSTCAQLGEVRLHREDTTFFVRLIAHSPAEASCQEDSIPFRLEVPLNIVNIPLGPYEVNVNGVTTSFDSRAVPASAGPGLDEYSLIPVEAVEIRVGQGSPIPVDIVVSGNWPDLCAQIAEVQNSVRDFQIDITILASTSSPCPPDRLGLPFLFELPLNTVEMPEGVYKISVNGNDDTTLEIPLKP